MTKDKTQEFVVHIRPCLDGVGWCATWEDEGGNEHFAEGVGPEDALVLLGEELLHFGPMSQGDSTHVGGE